MLRQAIDRLHLFWTLQRLSYMALTNDAMTFRLVVTRCFVDVANGNEKL